MGTRDDQQDDDIEANAELCSGEQAGDIVPKRQITNEQCRLALATCYACRGRDEPVDSVETAVGEQPDGTRASTRELVRVPDRHARGHKQR